MSEYPTLEDMVCNAGTPSADCQFCGRSHFAGGSRTCLEPEELHRLRELSKKHPERYLESEDDSLSLGCLDGRQVLWGCPCRAMKPYEEFIWSNRSLILRYIKARNASILADAKETEEMAQETCDE